MDDYRDFLLGKRVEAAPAGFRARKLPAGLFPWQQDIVRWACKLGRAALFAGCGLGKTAMQLAWADQVARHTGRPVLILAPLAVGPQTEREAEKFKVAGVKFCRDGSESGDSRIVVTNYQRILKDHFDPSSFGGVVLDESSILKSYMGTTKRLLCESFAATPYRLCCTATPSPNDHIELGNHSQFLGVMDSNEMLSRWFVADQGGGCKKKSASGGVGTKAHYRLKGHAGRDFWRWVASWAVCLDRPSDLGHPDDGFVLPPLETVEHVVGTDITDGAGDSLFRCDRLTATSLHDEMRRSAGARAAKVAELVNGSPDTWIVWCNTNYEADELRKVIHDAVEVRGSEPDDAKERKLTDFSRERFRVLLSKPSICGHGMNWQHCRRLAFVGLSFSQEQFYKAVRRSWRFGQTEPVECHVVSADGEGEVLAAVRKKEERHAEMRREMVAASREHLLSRQGGRRSLVSVDTKAAAGDGWTLHLGDCVEGVRQHPAESVGFTIFSPPFSGLYIYSEAEADMGNSADDGEFFRHFGYLVPELFRVTVPGRLCAVHCKDLPKYQGRDGVAGLRDFPGECVRLFESHGWTYHSRVTVWKCPVTERERTNRHALLHATVRRDSSAAGVGMADYLLVFRRPPREGDGLLSANPIVRPDGLRDYVGAFDPRGQDDKPHPSPYSRKKILRKGADAESIEVWQRYAEPVWWDVDQMDTLNERQARDSKDEKHLCPLQLGLIRRCLHLWSMPGDLILSPFAGIGSEGVEAVACGRRFVGHELKESYWKAACRNLKAAAEAASQRGLFDGEEVPEPETAA